MSQRKETLDGWRPGVSGMVSISSSSRYARPVSGSWRCDETYIRMKGQWTYLYRVVDKVGRTVDFYLSERRDVNAAQYFFRKAMKSVGRPRVITSRRLRRIAPCGSGTEVGRPVAEACPSAVEQISQQYG